MLAVSLHESPHWPYSGAADETRRRRGRGTTLNVPIAARHRPRRVYLARFRDEVLPAVERYAPDLVVIACGVDAHRARPAGRAWSSSDGRSARSPTDVRDLCAGSASASRPWCWRAATTWWRWPARPAEIAAAYSATRRT